MSGEGIKVPKREPKARAPEESPTEPGAEPKEVPKAEELGSPARSASERQFFLIEYVQEIMRGFRWLRATPKPEESVMNRVQKGFFRWSRGRKSRIGVVVVIGIIGISYVLFSAQASSTPVLPSPGGGNGGGGGPNHDVRTAPGSVSEQGQTATTMSLNTSVFATMKATLTWTDEPASNPFRRNAPDNLGLNVTAPNGMSWQIDPTTSGTVTWNLEDTTLNYGGVDWTFTVLGGVMGDEQALSGRPCPLCASDTSNAYSLTVDYTW